jgi:uncharacterized repeat protein (TIGR03803 family)
VLKTLYSFCSQPNCADGFQPSATLARATDGNFYGTTVSAGAIGYGTVFEITPRGMLTGVALILDIDLKLHGQPSVAGEVLIL